MADTVSKSWFAVFNNPEKYGFEGMTPEDICITVKNIWCGDSPTRSCAVIYCISAEGLPHLHCVFEDTKAMRFSVIKKCFPNMHIEETKGNKYQVDDYINKRGKFEEKGEKIIHSVKHGEIIGCQGRRTDLDIIDELIKQGFTPNEIYDINFANRKYEKMITDAYFRKRYNETPVHRNIITYWHLGSSGSGKTYTYVKLCEENGEDNVYLVTDYQDPFGKYNGERIIVLDEFRGQIPYYVLLNQVLSNYRVQVHSRYSNRYSLWTEVHFCTVYTPQMCYEKMVHSNHNIDGIDQLNRRITFMVYHHKDENGIYHRFDLPMCEYKGIEDLKARALKVAETQVSFDELAEQNKDIPPIFDE